MRPMRGRVRYQLPAVSSMAAKLAIGLVAGSVLSSLSVTLAHAILLFPDDVLHRFFVWQLLTYGFVEVSAMGVIFGALIIWQMGGALEMSWGSRRLLVFSVGITALAGVLTVVIARAFGGVAALQSPVYAGGFAMGTALWIAFGLHIGRGQSNFWGLPLTGNALAAVGLGFVLLSGIMEHAWAMILPALLTSLLTYAYFYVGSPRTLLLRLQGWRLRKKLRGRPKHLRVIDQGRNMPRDSDRYLH